MNVDDVHHFIVDAWHLIEAIEKDHSATRPQRQAAARLRDDEVLQICNALCNEEKHRKAEPGTPTWSIRQGFGLGRYGKGPFGVGEPSVTLESSDGRSINVLLFADKIVEKYHRVLD